MSATDIITAVAGSGGLLTAVGAGGRFVWNKLERRFTSIEAQLQACRDRETESQERRTIQLTVIELLWLKVKEFDPSAPVLERAKHLLDELKERARHD